MTRLQVICTLALLIPSPANAAITYFNWTPTGPTSGFGSAQGYDATYSLLPLAVSQTYVSNDAEYVSKYGAEMPGFVFDNSTALSGSFTFSEALGPGSVMVILDIDRGETMSFASNTFLSFVEHSERLVGGNSEFPTWSAAGQSITANVGAVSDSAATIIDVSGVTQLAFNFQTLGQTGGAIAFGVTAIPEPSAFGVLFFIGAAVTMKRRRRTA